MSLSIKMHKSSKILILGSGGMLGSSILNELKKEGYENFLLPRSKELNLIDSIAVKKYFDKNKPEYVFLCAAKVGGIYANITYKADFVYENLMMESNVIYNCHLNKIKKIVFVSSGCIYPRDTKNPIKEDAIFTGKLEPSNEHYATAKIAGIKMCEAYHDQYGLSYSVIVPNNIYGERDNYHPENSHVMAALIKKFHEAKTQGKDFVEIWGSGKQRREFIYVSDVAKGCILAMKNEKMNSSYNVGSGVSISIGEVANLVKEVIGFEGELKFDTTKPEGHFEKYFSCEKIKQFGWKAKIDLKEGIKMAYDWYLKSLK
jgi:GDP-L-fucose synthase